MKAALPASASRRRRRMSALKKVSSVSSAADQPKASGAKIFCRMSIAPA